MIYRAFSHEHDVITHIGAVYGHCYEGFKMMITKTAIAAAIIASISCTALAAYKLDWPSFTPADRSSCLKSTGSTGVYTDLLKCLEERRTDRQFPEGP
jgi:hypothetical protein